MTPEKLPDILTVLAVGIICAVLGRKLYFSAICLRNAVRGKRIPLTKYNYLRWEMPDNDIEHQILDEIRVNSLFLAGGLLCFATVILHFWNLLPVYLVYLPLAFCIDAAPIRKRYDDFYAVFSTKKRREDFSDDLVVYGARIEGTLTKLTEARILAVFLVAAGILRLLIG